MPALPYANGSIHLGHILEHIQVNIFVRFLRMLKMNVIYACGIDAHGTAIEISSQKLKMKPNKFINNYKKIHKDSFRKFNISFDSKYFDTNAKKNKKIITYIFNKLIKLNIIAVKNIKQFYDDLEKRFLSDRMIIGKCPICDSKNQYSDGCESCGAIYSPINLVNPKSIISYQKPSLHTSKHYFFLLNSLRKKINTLIKKKQIISTKAKNFLKKWLNSNLKEWDITRNNPYFGIKIPNKSNKYFYVWFDALLGYISFSNLIIKNRNHKIIDYWKNKNCKIFNFIGKDILYFHSLFWIAILTSIKYNIPNKIIIHGMLTIDGKKMSKSKKTFILSNKFAQYMDTESIRYYFGSKLNNNINDIDLNFHDFKNKTNSELLNKFINLISRSASFIYINYDGNLSNIDLNNFIVKNINNTINQIKNNYMKQNIFLVIKTITIMLEKTNQYIQNSSPWNKSKCTKEKAHIIMSTALYIGKICAGLLKPIIPNIVKNIEKILNLKKNINFNNIKSHFPKTLKINKYFTLFKKITNDQINNFINQK